MQSGAVYRLLLSAADCSSLHIKKLILPSTYYARSYYFKSALRCTAFGCRMMQLAVDCSILHCKCWVDWSNLFKSALKCIAFGCIVMQSAANSGCLQPIAVVFIVNAEYILCLKLILYLQCTAWFQHFDWGVVNMYWGIYLMLLV